MKTRSLQLAIAFLAFLAINAPATVLYVDLNSTNPTPPYTNWATAATNIQDAVAAAVQVGDFVLVTNGVYSFGGAVIYGQETNRVALTNAITVLSLNGPQVTKIIGGTQTRCAYVGSNAILSGFTITNGHTMASAPGNHVEEICGGGIWCEVTGVVTNCMIAKNSADINYGSGGGMYGGAASNCTFIANSAQNGGGAYQSTLANCLVISNWASYFGGGAYTGVLYNCTLTGNSCSGDGGGGGGARASTLYNCTLTRNRSVNAEGGGAYRSVLYNCMLSSNSARYYGGGGASKSTLYNCTLTGNQSQNYGGGTYQSTNYNCVLAGNLASYYGGGAYQGSLYNCTVSGNVATNGGGGVYNGTLSNCIVYFNRASSNSNWSGGTLRWCCTTPLPSGAGNITNEPAFVNLAAGDLRLHFGSPCIDAGTNLSAFITNDLDGNPRPLDGDGDGVAKFDMGAYELTCSVLWVRTGSSATV